ncbi:BTB/POZ domain-containing protein 17 [Plakobranchus ocellatus]|uniref:BTB/POZ domain-containing protein 17 n=1 Tax=Plakobranchus ocellatus TaxID=259542 RepID=A0AAV4BM60_9GAST|nr:BTB/POZ domain-containing protein 17 [Plakobranchus ocellatus]
MVVPPPGQVCVMDQGPDDDRSPRGLQQCLSPTSLASRLEADEGIDCYGNEREALSEQARFFNNKLLSDVVIALESDKFFAHKFVLVRSSQVFERMFTNKQWDSHKEKEVKLVEDPMCVQVFPRFLNFLYSCHIKLNIENTLPMLVLADKYNVADLRTVCLDFACFYIIPRVQLKDVFHVWFQYATKCYHHQLIKACVETLALKMDEIINSAEWETEWMSLDKDQLTEILASSCLVVNSEHDLWLAAAKWLTNQRENKHLSNKQFEILLGQILDLMRLPMMTPEQICQFETHTLVEQHRHLCQRHLLHAYKYHALPLHARTRSKEFTGKSCVLRNYTALRWDKRIVIPRLHTVNKGSEVGVRFSTRSCSLPTQTWEWELKVHPRGWSGGGAGSAGVIAIGGGGSGGAGTDDNVRIVLHASAVLEQPRAICYHLALVDSRGALQHTVTGHKCFHKARYACDTEMDKKVTASELLPPPGSNMESQLLVDGALILQITLKPAD